MEFYKQEQKLVVFKDKVILNLKEYQVKTLHVYENEVIRLIFDDYEIKMYKGDLKLIDLITTKVLDFKKVEKELETWQTFTVYPGLEVSINKSCSVIKVNDDYYNITKKIVHGNSNKYFCDKGEMVIKGKNGTWNAIGMGLKI